MARARADDDRSPLRPRRRALLGGALGLLARTMDDRAVASVLRNALASVESGELSEARRAPPPGAGPM